MLMCWEVDDVKKYGDHGIQVPKNPGSTWRNDMHMAKFYTPLWPFLVCEIDDQSQKMKVPCSFEQTKTNNLNVHGRLYEQASVNQRLRGR